MSFRKRSEVIGRPPAPGHNIPGRPSPSLPGRPSPNMPGRPTPNMPGRPIPNTSRIPPTSTIGSSHSTTTAETKPPPLFVRPSVATSQSTVSTGVPDLDKILVHQGLPTGTLLLVEESGTTDFASVIMRCFTSQGILHNRLENSTGTHSVIVGMNQMWASELPSIYKGSSRDQKRAKVLENESKMSVSNMKEAGGSRDMKIAWRYGINKQQAVSEEPDDQYNHQFDITTKLVPGPSAAEITFVGISPSALRTVVQITTVVEQHVRAGRVVRIVIPGLLNPSLYPPACSSPSYIVPLAHMLRALTRKYPENVVVVASLAVDLYSRESTVTANLEALFDGVVHLQPFNQEMSQLIERAYKNEPSKVQHGLVNVFKVPVLSERGVMAVHVGEYAFKNGRKRFEIEEWGIPVEDDAKDDLKKVDVGF